MFQELCISGHGNRLTAKTVIRLTSGCPNLQWIGDLRDWGIGSRERQALFSHGDILGNWELQGTEPKTAHQVALALDDNYKTFLDSYDLMWKTAL